MTAHAAPGENILFSGYRDGSFICAMRGLGRAGILGLMARSTTRRRR